MRVHVLFTEQMCEKKSLQVQQQAPTAANTFQQAFSQAGLPFNQAIGQQAAEFAAALAQAQQASQLLPQQINPSQLPLQFPAGQVCCQRSCPSCTNGSHEEEHHCMTGLTKQIRTI